ncbi:ATP phosphoribosyltransferase regulatory subunit [Alysiella filiformis]|uniref:ATP phosphoribosyltransferase regulatory subunit n=1 Tax=Alysiella filiformis DSM 16848 TaxID=1120981 RepID=A0A286EH23_9NEIS|nr:ATP phosphoribosyltransferase regulatory subunit [Alysiella filiformis]UBQ56916.1 ATP phosphoribosyltransferase regulatory subunit [Alysiella filiformis DSM 16848]SOD70104.1 ATP phosphoribosyltransferase regulatory subunit [Alysiella filiformis DSM 16848]
MQTWQLPQHIADILPERARQLESVKEQILALFRVHGFELVHPPLMEYSDSLLTHIDEGLSLKTIRVPDQLSGRQLGIRADITPQVARIDAHLLSHNQGINRLCYSGSMLHAKPDGLLATREPYQTGAELYGYAGTAADIELIDLMIKSLKLGGINNAILSLGHLGVFRALAQAANLQENQSRQLLATMQNKDREAVRDLAKSWQLDDIWTNALATLPELYGGRDILQAAKQRLPQLTAVSQAIDVLEQVCHAFPHQAVHIDFAEVRVDNYHTGLLYAAYAPEHHDAVARGGRYDGLGEYFGRSRPATGFSFDLRVFGAYLAASSRPEAVRVALADYAQAIEKINELREQGICVVVDYGMNDNSGSLKRLQKQGDEWILV